VGPHSLADSALAYTRRGWRVLPCRPRGKEPLTAHGVKDATCDLGAVEAWWHRWPAANIGVATGHGLLVLDADGDEGEESLAALEARHGALELTAHSFTGKGRHVWFKCMRPVPSSVRRLGPGLDVRSEGGYVIAPPSVHPNGRPYAWDVDHHLDEVSIAEAPPWLLESLATPSAPNGSASPGEWRNLLRDGVAEGQRNTALARVAGLLFRHLPPCDAWASVELVKAWNDARCRPPLPEDELNRVLNSIANRELRRRTGEARHGR
jgi:hypothetical protein